MRVLFWNINGVAREAAHCKLKELIREFKPDVFCLAEPKVCYLDSIRPSILNRSKHAIYIEVDGVHISFVHASYVQVIRRSLWQQLNLQDESIPWLVMGDFNCILRLDEKNGGLEPRTSAINEFSDWLDDNNLFEADSLGSKFTWTNSQSGTNRIISKLDRVVINAACLAKFENWRCKALSREVSDHSTLLGYPFVVPRPKRAPFRGDKGVKSSGFGNIHSRLKQDHFRFESAALCSDEDPSDVTKLNLMKDALAKLSETRLQHNTMLKQKARNQWLVEGSSNSTFFHNSIRRSSNTIYELVDSDGHTISDYDQLRDHIVQFYEAKFNGHETDIDASLFDYEHVSIYDE
ncbi:uncharacterized protein LOC113348446 [Papaver somniferum]|uniref:uncharacterized protein LOC113348446 n=1 Tax=Papaver somniferum TaxID=3469 RepID=UPI000E70573B|nr:uncharacterized protein LOC113348446 [Papaver somniferum]